MGGRVAYLEKRVGPEPVRTFHPGATLPAHASAMGKVLLAFTPQVAAAVLATHSPVYTDRTLDSPERLRRVLRTVRMTKLAVSDGELVEGDFAVAVPVFAPDWAVLAALEVAVRDPRTDFQLCRTAVVVAAGALSRQLAGFSQPARPHLRVVPMSPEARPDPRPDTAAALESSRCAAESVPVDRAAAGLGRGHFRAMTARPMASGRVRPTWCDHVAVRAPASGTLGRKCPRSRTPGRSSPGWSNRLGSRIGDA